MTEKTTWHRSLRQRLFRIFAKVVLRRIDPGKIVFYNLCGKGYGCNPRAIADALHASGADYDLVWIVSDPDRSVNRVPPYVRTVAHGSFRAFCELVTARVWCVNVGLTAFVKKFGLRKRPGQTCINTWHGSLGIKKCGIDRPGHQANAALPDQSFGLMVDYFISHSAFEDVTYRRWLGPQGEILRLGSPRNDILFNLRERQAVGERVRGELGIRPDEKIALYAPTWLMSAEEGRYLEEFDALTEALTGRFGGNWRICLRYHPSGVSYATRSAVQTDNVIDVTHHPDMRDFLCAADVILTDYSSCIFDFMLTGRPGFVYATNIPEYERRYGLYFPLESTPFPVARTVDELCANIRDFDGTKYAERVASFLREKEYVEDGHATERTVALIRGLKTGA